MPRPPQIKLPIEVYDSDEIEFLVNLNQQRGLSEVESIERIYHEINFIKNLESNRKI